MFFTIIILIYVNYYNWKARDYVDGMWRMLQQSTAEDYVLATNESECIYKFKIFDFLKLWLAHSVREFVDKAFKTVNILIKWVVLLLLFIFRLSSFM